MKNTQLTVLIWREGEQYVSKCPEFNLASCGISPKEARENLKEAVELFLENAQKLSMMDEIAHILEIKEKYVSTLDFSLH